MSISVQCQCKTRLKVPDHLAGKTVKCPRCGLRTQVPSPQAASPEPTPPSSPSERRPELQDNIKTCPHCGNKMAVAKSLVGQVIQCPHCATQLQITDSSPIAIPQVNTAITTYEQVGQAAGMPAWNTLEDRADLPARRRRDERSTAHSLGITSLVLGIVSFIVAIIPCMGILALPLIGIGIILAIIAFFIAIMRQGAGIGYSIGGLAANGAALLLALFWLGGIHGVIQSIDKTREKEDKAGKKGEAAVERPAWAPTETIKKGDLRVQVVSASIGKVPLKDIHKKSSSSKDDLLMIKLELLNTNPTKKVNYRTWAGRAIAFERDYATVEDNFGNSYNRVGFGFGTHPVGAVEGSISIYPSKSINDTLVFEAPLDTATHLDLELPAKNYGGDGKVRFRIPMKWVSR